MQLITKIQTYLDPQWIISYWAFDLEVDVAFKLNGSFLMKAIESLTYHESVFV